jgi:DNA mismatch repair protein MutL
MYEPRQSIAEIPHAEVEKICAGEVVERPLSVVKELIENALDAGAQRISIELEDGGKELVRVSDDGSGIPYAELPLALKRHHTSKLRCLDDLFGLSTLGFRGEALGSIAAVARLALTSRRGEEELGGRIEASGGALVSQARVNFQRGTEVEVRELFFNTPARKKFLKSRQAEVSQITALVTTYALAYPEVRWTLSSGGRTLLSTDGDGSTPAVLAAIAGPEVAGGLIELHFEFPPSEVHGLVSDPQHHRHNRARQWYFVNRRPVSNKLLYRAVDDALRDALSPGKYPAGVFFLDIPPEELDVNVHPMKSEVNFAQPQAVYSLLVTAVRRALGEAAAQRQRRLTHGLAAVVHESESLGVEAEAADDGALLLEPPAPQGQRAIPVYRMDQPFVPPTAAAPAPRRTIPAQHPQLAEHQASSATEAAVAGPPPQRGIKDSIADEPQMPAAMISGAGQLPACELTAQVAGTYLVLCTPDAVYLVDQHAAHERLLFDQLTAAAQGQGQPARQKLLFPLIIPLNSSEAESALEYIPALAALGFDASLGAGASLIVAAAPLPLAGKVTPELLHAVLGELCEHGRSALLADRAKELAAALACKAAIKGHQPLPNAERQALWELIQSRLTSLTCPHGRPVALRLGAAELERLFLR